MIHGNRKIRSRKAAAFSPGPTTEPPSHSIPNRHVRLFAWGGFASAFAASSCCILPLLLAFMGIGGSWLSTLSALEPYRPYFLFGAVLLLSVGYWGLYFRSRTNCADADQCDRRNPARFGLWAGTVLTFLAATVSLWAPLFY